MTIAYRVITHHKLNACNDELGITADNHGCGGAAHSYVITGFDLSKNPAEFIEDIPTEWCRLVFQNGPIAEVGTNGITHEALLAILIDRLQGFQSGPFACRENAIALTKLQEALLWLNHRTVSRMARGVEGTMQV